MTSVLNGGKIPSESGGAPAKATLHKKAEPASHQVPHRGSTDPAILVLNEGSSLPSVIPASQPIDIPGAKQEQVDDELTEEIFNGLEEFVGMGDINLKNPTAE